MDQKTEAEIVVRILKGDRQAYALLVEEYKTVIYSLAYRMTGQAEDAQDLAQESFLQAYKNLSRFDTKRSFFTWLYTVSLNVIRNHLKKSKRKHYDFQYDKISSENFSTGSQAACFIENKAREELLQSCLPELSPDIRELLILRYYQNLSFESVAEITGLSVSAVKMRVYRGLEKLKKIMEHM
ncbi:MAG: RNA polymerase sigma factor [Smithella sp.]|nr:RNA polymerase sigma factor [Smithella sp.]